MNEANYIHELTETINSFKSHLLIVESTPGVMDIHGDERLKISFDELNRLQQKLVLLTTDAASVATGSDSDKRNALLINANELLAEFNAFKGREYNRLRRTIKAYIKRFSKLSDAELSDEKTGYFTKYTLFTTKLEFLKELSGAPFSLSIKRILNKLQDLTNLFNNNVEQSSRYYKEAKRNNEEKQATALEELTKEELSDFGVKMDTLQTFAKSIDSHNKILSEAIANYAYASKFVVPAKLITDMKSTVDLLTEHKKNAEEALIRSQIVKTAVSELCKYNGLRKDNRTNFIISLIDEINHYIAEDDEFIPNENIPTRAEKIKQIITAQIQNYPGTHFKPILNRIYTALTEAPKKTNVLQLSLFLIDEPNFRYGLNFFQLMMKFTRHKDEMPNCSKKDTLTKLIGNLYNKHESLADKLNAGTVSKTDLMRFKEEFHSLLHSQDDNLGIHRDTGIMRALANVIASLATLIRLVTTKYYSEEKRARLFFDKTESLIHVEKIEKAFDAVMENIPTKDDESLVINEPDLSTKNSISR